MNAAQTLWQHRTNGVTVSPLSGKVVKTKRGYAVGGVCSGLVFDANVTEEEFTASVDSWLDETLPKRNVYCGVWFDTESQKIFVDGTDLISNLDNALMVAKRRNELAIWSFRDANEVRVDYSLAA